jgi:hypothetical protein
MSILLGAQVPDRVNRAVVVVVIMQKLGREETYEKTNQEGKRADYLSLKLSTLLCLPEERQT